MYCIWLALPCIAWPFFFVASLFPQPCPFFWHCPWPFPSTLPFASPLCRSETVQLVLFLDSPLASSLNTSYYNTTASTQTDQPTQQEENRQTREIHTHSTPQLETPKGAGTAGRDNPGSIFICIALAEETKKRKWKGRTTWKEEECVAKCEHMNTFMHLCSKVSVYLFLCLSFLLCSLFFMSFSSSACFSISPLVLSSVSLGCRLLLHCLLALICLGNRK